MTKEEVYKVYLKWLGDSTALSFNNLFDTPVANIDVYENDKFVINHLYYLVVKTELFDSEYFIFYEANLFVKYENGNIRLLASACYV